MVEDNNFVLAVMGGGEMDDRERSVIEDEMDVLRMGGYSTANFSEPCLARRRKGKYAHKRVIIVVGIINSESSHPFPQVGTGIGKA